MSSVPVMRPGMTASIRADGSEARVVASQAGVRIDPGGLAPRVQRPGTTATRPCMRPLRPDGPDRRGPRWSARATRPGPRRSRPAGHRHGSSMMASASRNIFSDVGTARPSNAQIPIANAISVAAGTAQPRKARASLQFSAAYNTVGRKSRRLRPPPGAPPSARRRASPRSLRA
jgi:hypothetical protein